MLLVVLRGRKLRCADERKPKTKHKRKKTLGPQHGGRLLFIGGKIHAIAERPTNLSRFWYLLLCLLTRERYMGGVTDTQSSKTYVTHRAGKMKEREKDLYKDGAEKANLWC
jgi:hypothetical protein